MARYRVLVVNHAVEMGGAEKVLLRLLDSLDQDIFEPAIACPGEGPLTEQMENRGIPVFAGHPSDRLLNIRRQSLGGNNLSVLGYPADLAASVYRLSRLVRNGGFDLVYPNSAKADIYGSAAGRLAGRPVVWRLHDIVTAEAFNKLNMRLFKVCATRFTRRVLCVSRAVEDAMAELGVPRAKLTTVYNGIDLASESASVDRAAVRRSLGVDEDAPLAGMVGRLVDWKGPDYFIEAAGIASLELPDARFLLVGDAVFGEQAYVDELKRLASDRGLDGKLVFTGFRDDVSEIMASMDLLVHASVLPDPLPTVLIEAMARSRPVVGTDAGGVREIVADGATGFVVPPRDARAMARAMTEILRDPDRGRSMGDAGRARAGELFDIKVTTRIMEKEMLDAIAAKSEGA
jgi:glycosyltransferase involved in cell wall biosynthesis